MNFSITRMAVLVVLFFGMRGVAIAADPVEAEAVSALVAQLEQDVVALKQLDERITTAPEHDVNALIYRRDERSFKLLLELDKLVRANAELPQEEPVRAQVNTFIAEGLAGAGDGILQRIDELGGRIADLQTQIESTSGADLVVAEAYVQSLETLRFRYYEALVDLIEGRKLLALPGDSMATDLLPLLYLHGETLVGRIDYTGGALEELNTRLAQDSSNADVAAAVGEMSRQQELDLVHLDAMIGLLERLGEDPAQYKAVILQQGQGLSIDALEAGVVVNLLQDGWHAVQEAVKDQAPNILFQLLIFIAIVLFFRYLSRMTKRAVKAACERPGTDMSQLLKDVLVSVCGSTVTVLGVLIALSQVGISLGPMLAGLGVAGFVVGFALQDTLGNFAAGGMILVYRPYDVDDFVEVAGASGLVKKMSLVSTTITTFDNQTLVVPNSKIWGDVIKNVTAQKLRRVDLVFGIGYGDDIEHAERVFKEVLADHEMVLKKPEALIKLHELADSSVNFAVRPWVKTEDYWTVYWDLTREVKMRLDREGISIPFPQRDVHLFQEKSSS